ncbi:hypothetical protein [Parasitella parasitica]|uniref:Uncharacterized protein n=1 Tax=Parasitella parasitica TaxID=35722 RepID=A0A0B7NR90_9FUNG|nr:hypothetical protein [Parasitella parasitica]
MAHPSIAVIGSGFSGMVTAIQLEKKLYLSADIFEPTEDIGGTWHYNQYPGCACDVPSHLYSFSFELNPNWSQQYSSQREIHEYMRSVAKKYSIYKQTQFNTEVVCATWIDETNEWEIELKTSGSKETQLGRYNYIFSGLGAICVPNIPNEFQSFQGKIIHSAYWDHDYDFAGKTVAVVGSGTSSSPIITPGCKRVGISDDYLQALCQRNVTVNTSPIANVQGQTITTVDGSETQVDVLCLATEFNVNGFLGHMQVHSRKGVHLNKLWDENSAKTYKTVNIHGFPNFFMMLLVLALNIILLLR